MRYAVHDGRNGKVFLTNQAAARTLHQIQTGKFDEATADQDALSQAYGLVERIRAVSLSELTSKQAFNPLFIRWAGIDLGRYEQSIGRMAAVAGPLCWPVFFALLVICLALGLISEWAILDSASQAISFEGIATFVLVSPFLKLPHELGHAMAARAHQVPLRNAGIVFVGLFPLPFIDTSMADICANRAQRIQISLAGIFVDLLIALLAFVAWHFVDGTFLKTIMANIFVFSSLNSILFNGNPLMRLDGYFAFTDWIGHRNLSSASAAILKDARNRIMTFGADGVWPQNKEERRYLIYGFASTLYKLNILATILWLTLPRFLGGGVILALWGAYAMFFSPLLSTFDKPKAQTEGVSTMARKTAFLGIFSAMIAVCLFIPLPFRVTVPVALDINGVYAVQTQEAGTLTQIAPVGPVQQGQILFHLENAVIDQDADVAVQQLNFAELQRAVVLQRDPTQARIATKQLETPQKELDVLRDRQSALVRHASEQGAFYPNADARSGQFFAEGSRIGYLLPEKVNGILVGQFPETRIALLREGTPEFSLWNAGQVLENESITDLQLVQINQMATETGQRSYQVVATVTIPAEMLHGRQQYLKISLGTAPVYDHVYDVFLSLRRNYLNARIGSAAQ